MEVESIRVAVGKETCGRQSTFYLIGRDDLVAFCAG